MNHDKFRKYWESTGKPQLECKLLNEDYWHLSKPHLYPVWDKDTIYRIVCDTHWKLRAKWIESDFTLPIEFYNAEREKWTSSPCPMWTKTGLYREASASEEAFPVVPCTIKDKERAIGPVMFALIEYEYNYSYTKLSVRKTHLHITHQGALNHAEKLGLNIVKYCHTPYNQATINEVDVLD